MQRRCGHHLSILTLLVLIVVFGSNRSTTIVFAQAGKAEVTGEVRDQNGAAIPQAGIVATEVTTSQAYVTTATTENADIALIKRVLFGETTNLERRAEAFNVTNTPPLGAPNAVLGAAGFGSITSAGDPRVVQLGIKLNF